MTTAAPSTVIALAAIALSGCGGSAHPARRATSPCPAKPAAALARVIGARAAPPRVVGRQTGLFTCLYAAGAARVRLTLDHLPQADFRWERAQVERAQTAVEWSNTPSQAPHDVAHLGVGAFWVPATRELVATDGQQLVTARVLSGAGASPRAVARRVVAAALGPSRPPVRTGP